MVERRLLFLAAFVCCREFWAEHSLWLPNRHVDISLYKVFPLTESIRLQLRGEAYNLTNTASFANPASAFGSGTFGVISGTLGTPRQLGLMLKLQF